MTSPMPPAEVDVDAGLARRLLRAQFPQWADLTLSPSPAVGWDNVIFRLGRDLAVRLPRRQLGADLVEHEQRWLPQLAARLPVPVPEPLGFGVPAESYPWRWSVCRWVRGEMAATAAGIDAGEMANDLAAFVGALHVEAPPDAPRNALRGTPLSDRDDRTRAALRAVGGIVDVAAAAAAWDEALAVPDWPGPAVWLHGDLHPANIVVAGGRLSGVIDFGDLAAGDPATDLVSGWMLLPPPARRRFREASGVDHATWDRGRGWALSIGLACIANSADNAVIAAIGRRAVAEVLAERS